MEDDLILYEHMSWETLSRLKFQKKANGEDVTEIEKILNQKKSSGFIEDQIICREADGKEVDQLKYELNYGRYRDTRRV